MVRLQVSLILHEASAIYKKEKIIVFSKMHQLVEKSGPKLDV